MHSACLGLCERGCDGSNRVFGVRAFLLLRALDKRAHFVISEPYVTIGTESMVQLVAFVASFVVIAIWSIKAGKVEADLLLARLLS